MLVGSDSMARPAKMSPVNWINGFHSTPVLEEGMALALALATANKLLNKPILLLGWVGRVGSYLAGLNQIHYLV